MQELTSQRIKCGNSSKRNVCIFENQRTKWQENIQVCICRKVQFGDRCQWKKIIEMKTFEIYFIVFSGKKVEETQKKNCKKDLYCKTAIFVGKIKLTDIMCQQKWQLILFSDCVLYSKCLGCFSKWTKDQFFHYYTCLSHCILAESVLFPPKTHNFFRTLFFWFILLHFVLQTLFVVKFCYVVFVLFIIFFCHSDKNAHLM